MTEERQPSADQVWDAWTAARGADPLITPRVFARRFGEHAKAVRRELELVLALEAARPPGSAFEHVGGEGELRFDAYTVTGEIGRGGFGVVYRAQGPSGEVAVKVLNPLLSAGAEQEARLLEEARMLKRLDHPNVVALHECGLTRGVFWIAMELVRGVQLDQLPELAPAARHARTLALGLALCDGLAHAHDAGIVHCDLKPSNVMLDADGVLKVLDFGFAERPEVLVSVSSSEAGAPLSRGGTPAFMAPEQLDPEGAPGPLTDVHGIGYLLLLLSRPEVADEMRSSKRLTRLRLGEVAELPRACFAGLPRDLAVVVRRCLEPEPEYRYPSVAALREDLQALHDGKPLVHGGPGPARRAWRRARRRPRACAASGAVLLVASVLWHQLVYDPRVPVRIESVPSGKQVYLKGESVGVTPATLYLRAGSYPLALQWGGGEQPTYGVTLEVERGASAAHTWPMNPGVLDQTFPDDPFAEVPAGAGAWVRVATRAVEASVTLHGVPGHEAVPVDNAVSLRLPFGTHQLELRGEGYRPVARELVIDDELMRFWTEELDPVESSERTVTVYGPLEEVLRGRVDRENVRVYVESAMRAEDGLAVLKRYFGPLESDAPASVGFWVGLDGPLASLKLEAPISQQVNDWSRSWVGLSAGAGPDALVPLAAFAGKSFEPDAGWQTTWGALPSKLVDVDFDGLLLPEVRGARRIYVRYTIGPSAAGEQYSYGQALRTEGGPELRAPVQLPEGAPRPVVWNPALTVRYRLAD